MDGFKATNTMVIGATNNPQMVDSAIRDRLAMKVVMNYQKNTRELLKSLALRKAKQNSEGKS